MSAASQSVIVRLDARMVELLRDVARVEGATLGDLIRRAVRAYLQGVNQG